MSLVFNGNSTIENIVFNGNTVEHLIYNGVEVWSKGGYVSTFPNGTTTDTGNYHFTIQESYPIDNIIGAGIENTMHTNFNLEKNSRYTRMSQIYIELDKTFINSIPSNATISSVTWNIKYRLSSTTYITSFTVKLASGTTTKGTAITNRSAYNVTYTNISGGSWTRSELDNIRVYMSATHSANPNNAYIEIYGIEIDIAYK